MSEDSVRRSRQRAEAALRRVIGTHKRAVDFYVRLGRHDKAERERSRLEHARQVLEKWRRGQRS